MENVTRTIHLPEAILTEILARLPLRSISRFKSVSTTWKSTLESVYFRRLFVSLHRNYSPYWSLRSCEEQKELIGCHGCKTWDLPKSLPSYIPLFLQTYGLYCRHSSNGLVLLDSYDSSCYVGNPVLRQWVKIPPIDVDSYVIGLVTRVDKDGVVLGFKVVRLDSVETKDKISCTLSMCLYSSETGVWNSKIVHCSTLVSTLRVKTLNGTLYFNSKSETEVLVSHDLYSESDQCRVVPFPEPLNHNNCNDVLTTSGGYIMYISRLTQDHVETIFKIWRLHNDESWQLLWEVPITGCSILPVAMDPFDSDIVYLWCFYNCHWVQCNLRTQKERILGDEGNDENQDYFMNDSSDECLGDIWTWTPPKWLFQFVTPRWMESIPRPPQDEDWRAGICGICKRKDISTPAQKITTGNRFAIFEDEDAEFI